MRRILCWLLSHVEPPSLAVIAKTALDPVERFGRMLKIRCERCGLLLALEHMETIYDVMTMDEIADLEREVLAKRQLRVPQATTVAHETNDEIRGQWGFYMVMAGVVALVSVALVSVGLVWGLWK